MAGRHDGQYTDRPGDLTVGVLGGMGPHATVDFFKRLVELTPVEKDWDHLHIVVEDNPRMPSRSRAILFGEESPAPYLAAGARRLAAMGAGLIAVPCNSAAYYLAEARAAVSVPILDPVVATAAAVRAARVTRPVVLGGIVTHRAGLYARELERDGIRVVAPSDAEQDEVCALIEALKRLDTGPEIVARTARVIAAAVARGADAVILGCTEFGLIAGAVDAGVPVFNSNELLARSVVAAARR